MRILHITQPYPPMISGASLAVAQLAQGMARNGHDLLVIAASDRGDGYSTQNGRLRVVRLPSYPNPARLGQRFLFWPQRDIDALIEDFDPNIIHLHEPVWLGICGLRAAQKFDKPVVSTFHQLPWFVTKYAPAWLGNTITVEQLLWHYGKWFMRQCSASIVPMPQIASEVQKHSGITPHVIPYGADLEKFDGDNGRFEPLQLRCKLNIPPDTPVILHTGRLDLDKGVDLVIHAAARIMSSVDAHLLIVGDGRQRQALGELCTELGIQDRCHFTGFVDPDGDLPAIYNLASVFVTASEIETFGIVVLEAMAAARPVVAVDATCIPELVDNEHSGFLLPPKDVQGMAEKIKWLLDNPLEAKKMGQAGQRLSRKFDQKTMINRHIALYQALQLADSSGQAQARKREKQNKATILVD